MNPTEDATWDAGDMGCGELVLELPDFDDDPARCGEKILEAIQQAWIDEAD